MEVNIIGKSYTWGNTSIKFNDRGVISTIWAPGQYYSIDANKVKAKWLNFNHTLSFNSDYTEFTSVCHKDNAIGTHKLIRELSKIPSIKVDYKSVSTELCMIGKKYNVDKSSQRENPGPENSKHCHPYSIVYNALFREKRNSPITFCEIGIAEGRSLLMWEEYFSKAQIYGYEFLPKYLKNWKDNYSNRSRIYVDYTDVTKDAEIVKSFEKAGVLYDCIIDDSTHARKDMIKIIKNSIRFLKPGGMIIVEDIEKIFDELWFYNDLKDILSEFQTVFFVDLEHDRRNSGMLNNDKLLIMVKNGAPIFNCSLF